MPGCDIIIPVWNQPELTKGCLDSIARHTKTPYNIIVIDNASASKTKKLLEDFAKANTNVKILRNERNEGFIKAVNKGVKSTTGDYVCILNNDTLVTEGWLKEMIALLDRNPGIAIVNPSSNTLGQRLSGKMTPDDFAKNSRRESGTFVELGSAFGFCMLTRRGLFGEIGLFDEIYGMGNYEDTDFSLRAKAKGYKTVRAIASYVYHKESTSFNLLKGFKKEYRDNKKIFEAKWGRVVRVAVVFREVNKKSFALLRNILNDNAKEKSWVYVISPVFDTKEFFQDFSNLSFYHFEEFFYIRAFFKVLFKKKRPEIVYCDNKIFLNFLKGLKLFHNAKILKMEGAA